MLEMLSELVVLRLLSVALDVAKRPTLILGNASGLGVKVISVAVPDRLTV